MGLRATTDDLRGWAGSIFVHALLALILFLWNVDISVSEPEYVEVGWGSVTSVPDHSAARPALPGREGMPAVPAAAPTRNVALPERTFNTGADQIAVPRTGKMDADGPLPARPPRAAERSSGAKEQFAGVGTGKGQDERAAGSGSVAGDVRNPAGPGGVGSGVGGDLSMSVQWAGGGTRRKVDGDLPRYPAGVKTEAQIVLAAVVAPDGSVRSVKPAQKGETRLEDAAMKAVRSWRFEPLRASVPQADQSCRITFNFTLR